MRTEWHIIRWLHLTDRIYGMHRFRRDETRLPIQMLRVREMYGDAAATRWWLARRMRGDR